MTDKPLNEINRAYYPLIGRIALISIGLDILFFTLFFSIQSFTGGINALWVAAYIIKIAIFVYFISLAAYRWTSIYYDIEPEKGLLKKYVGLYFPSETSYSMKNLHSVSFKQTPIGKALKYGDLILVFTNREGNKEELRIVEVVDPQTYKNFFDKYLMK